MVGLTFVRNLCSTVMIFAKEPWIAGVGLQNAFIMMAVILSVILFGNGVIIAFGKRFRFRCRKTYGRFAAKQFRLR